MDFKALSDPVVLVGDSGNKRGFFSKIRPPRTPFFNGKFLGGAVTVLLLFAVGIGVFLSQKPTQLTPQASNGAGELSLKPQTLTVSQNQEFQIDVFLDTKDIAVTALQVKVLFDQTKFELLNTTQTDFFSTILSAPQNTPTSTFFAAGSDPGEKGAGNVATLRFKAIGAPDTTPAKIQISRDFTEAVSNESGDFNAVSAFNDADITISDTASPSASSLSSPSPSPLIKSASCYDDSGCSPGEYCQFVQQTCPEGMGCAAVTSGYCLSKSGKGDANNDGNIDLQDLSIMYSGWSPAINTASGQQLDFNNDNKINSFDNLQMNLVLQKLKVISGN